MPHTRIEEKATNFHAAKLVTKNETYKKNGRPTAPLTGTIGRRYQRVYLRACPCLSDMLLFLTAEG